MTKLGNMEATIRGLRLLGFTQDESPATRKYMCLSKRTEDGATIRRWVGKSGAFRSGDTITGSVSLTGTKIHAHVMAIGRGE